MHRSTTSPAPSAPRRHWLPALLGGCGLALLPWIAVLSRTLPAHYSAAHWNLAWTGLDSAEALGLIGTAVLARRHDPRAGLAAAATATLLVVDAWFDVLTSAAADRPEALAMATLAELPLAALCTWYAARRTAPPRPPVAPDLRALRFGDQPRAESELPISAAAPTR